MSEILPLALRISFIENILKLNGFFVDMKIPHYIISPKMYGSYQTYFKKHMGIILWLSVYMRIL